MSSFTVTGLISKLEHRDRDFRYMASSDLLAELQKESFKPDSDGEKKLCRSILKLLHDQSSDVQGLAVKCLSPLVRKVHGQLVEEIMVELVKDVLTGKEDQRDICSIGLKTARPGDAANDGPVGRAPPRAQAGRRPLVTDARGQARMHGHPE